MRSTLLVAGLLCGSLLSSAPQPASGQATTDTATVRVAQSDSAVAVAPYRSERSIGEHLLALPSTALHLITRPIGALLIWAESEGYAEHQYGLSLNLGGGLRLFPLIRFGDPSRRSIGVALRSEHLLNTERTADLRFRYTNTENFSTSFFFSTPPSLGPRSFLDVEGGYRTDTREPIYLGPQGSGPRTSYRIERAYALVDVGVKPRPRWGWDVALSYEHMETGRGDGSGASRFDPTKLSGVGTSQLLSGQASLLLNLSKSLPARANVGPLFYAQYGYTHGLEDDRFRYHHLRAEAQQYVPLPLLDAHRRLALRVRFDKQFPVGEDGAVPFYRQITLGGPQGLRGLARNRYRDEGALLTTLEYRYPIWDTWDALLFVDGGQVFDELSAVQPRDWQWGYGVGVRFYSRSGVSLRLDLAFANGQFRPYAEADPNFILSTRRRDLR